MSDSITSIRGYINAVRLQLSTSELLSAILKISGYLLPTYFVLLVIESVFYMESFYRQKIMAIFWVLFGTGYCYHFLRFLINKNQWFGNRNDEIIARYIGKKSSVIADRILNTLQIENKKLYGSDDSSLIQHAVDRMKQKLDSIPPEAIQNIISRNMIKPVVSIAGICLVLYGIFNTSLSNRRKSVALDCMSSVENRFSMK